MSAVTPLVAVGQPTARVDGRLNVTGAWVRWAAWERPRLSPQPCQYEDRRCLSLTGFIRVTLPITATGLVGPTEQPPVPNQQRNRP